MLRKFTFKKFACATLALVITLAMITPEDAFARGGSFRSSSSRSYSRPSSSASKSSYSRPKTPSRSSSWSKTGSTSSSSKGRTTTASKNSASSALYNKAKASGTTFSSRSNAVSKFKSNPAMTKKYTSSYATKPTTRPSHIPSTYKDSSGGSHTVIYDRTHGGYGYYSGGGPGLGTWMMYSMMTDSIMTDRMMRHNNYYYGAPPVYHRTSGWGILSILGTIMVVVFIGFIVMGMVNRS